MNYRRGMRPLANRIARFNGIFLLERLDLIERTPTDVRAKKEIILAFLP